MFRCASVAMFVFVLPSCSVLMNKKVDEAIVEVVADEVEDYIQNK